jgi:hypothetical protein
VDLVQKAADSVSGQSGGLLDQPAGRVLQSFAAARHHGEHPGRDAVVRLAVSFTTAAERSLLAVFFRAAVLGTLLQDISSSDEAMRLALAQWVEDEVTDKRLAALSAGALVLRPATTTVGCPRDQVAGGRGRRSVVPLPSLRLAAGRGRVASWGVSAPGSWSSYQVSSWLSAASRRWPGGRSR